ncbi:MAG TPA: ABC transporter permease subunit [Tepidisphaeraceae bacterium]|jgi:NitT/TauT family transport system permease protein|nr:ABC transporter permease subunit [Tepidisphaeraceae bacterium]
MNRAGLMRLGVWILILAAWEGAFRLLRWNNYIFPAPSHVLDATLAMLNIRTGFGEAMHPGWPKPIDADVRSPDPIWRGPLIGASLTSAVRLGMGFAISIALGAILGAAMWRLRWLDEFLGPLFLGFQTLPSVCWVPLSTLVFGLRESGILFVLVMGSFFAIALALRDGLRTIPIAYQNAGRMLGARGWKLYRYVLLPASLPALAASLRQGFSFAWRSLMGAELMFVAVQHHGLGFMLELGRNFNDVGQVVAVMIIMIILGILADRLVFARLERGVLLRFGLLAA